MNSCNNAIDEHGLLLQRLSAENKRMREALESALSIMESFTPNAVNAINKAKQALSHGEG